MADQSQLSIKKSESWKMFDEISPRYDFLNHFLSMGLDILWRKRFAEYLYIDAKTAILDLATGTADVLLIFFQKYPQIAQAFGIDLSEGMMAVGREKIKKAGLENKIELKHGDANKTPFGENIFDNVTIAFGIRNVEDPLIVLKEMRRVLKSERYALILEFSLPNNPVLRFFHIGYLRYVVPSIGWVFSGHYRAYKYLNKTIESFPYGKDFCDLMIKAGFTKAEAHPLMFGIATIYRGTK